MLAVGQESTEHPMSGVYGLNWLPTGPGVMTRILNWMGFPETRLTSWVANPWVRTHGGQQSGRLQIVGAREPGRLDQLEAVAELRAGRAATRPGFRRGTGATAAERT
jgi:hypothetical protein